jgi:hypothetical protein
MIRVVHPGSRIRMLTFSHPGSRIQGSKRHPIPDPGSGSATLIPTVLLLLYDFLSFKNDVKAPSKSNKQVNSGKKTVFCWHLEGQ